MTRMMRSAAVVLATCMLALSAGVVAPAQACGCGAYIPAQEGPAVTEERALVAWDGAGEDVLMSFDVRGSSASAAWVMPVPSAARVTLGEPEVFDEIDRLTAPRIEYRDSWWPTFDWMKGFASEAPDTARAPAPTGVNVLARQRIGPFDVTRLTAGDPAELADWLAGRGFPHPPGLDRNLAPYVQNGWEIVAVQLVPGAAGESLTGGLQPLRLSFRSDEVVYPMRLSQSATTPQTVDLTVLADHRMDPSQIPVAGNDPSLTFAGRIEAMPPALAEYAGEAAFLTRWKNTIDDPSAIDGDYVFVQASADTPFQEVIYRYRDRGDITGLVLVALVAVNGITVVVTLIAGAIVRSRRRGQPTRG